MTHAASTRLVFSLDEPEIAPEVAHVVGRRASSAGAEVTLLRVLVPAKGDSVVVPNDVGPLVDLAECRARAELRRAVRAVDGVAVHARGERARGRIVVHPAASGHPTARAS
jgi:hypothetical protein